jgi:parallel beta-helix repeat protein
MSPGKSFLLRAVLSSSLTVFFLLFIVTEKAVAAGNSYYLSTTGNDTYSGTSTGNAWATLEHACQQLHAGDTLYVMPGLYTDQHGVPADSGTQGNPITVTAYSGRPEFSGTSGTAFDLNHYDYWTIENLYIHGYPGGVDIENNTGCHVIGNIISSNTWAVQFVNTSNGSLQNNTISYGQWNTIQIDGTFPGTSNILIRNNDISYAVGHAMLDFMGEFNHITVQNNVFHATDQIAIYVHQTANSGFTGEYLTIDSNTITGTGGGMQFDDPVDNVTISSNTICGLVDSMGTGGLYMRLYDDALPICCQRA